MNSLHYIGFDVHKKTISFCVKTAAGEIVEEGSMLAQREVLRQWASARPQPWRGAMEATLFSAWIYDTLKPYGEQLEMAHPAKMKAISAGKKKSDTIDARTIADLLRCNLLPACYVARPRIRELRRLLRYRSLVVSEAVRMKNKICWPSTKAARPSKCACLWKSQPKKLPNSAAIVRPFLAISGTGQRSLDSRCSLPSVSRPAGQPNSYFADRARARFPQMDVWPSCCFGR
jgi:hypothetical protein